MRVSLDTYGGLLGGVGGNPVVIDSDDLGDEARDELLRLVRDAVDSAHSGAAPSVDTERLRDAQTYEIAIENDRSTVLTATDGNVSEEFARLRDWLRARKSD
ncbi:protealysin inhibitor emfourin [Nocardia arizonensis]|uniref:protealysin inhibitor emfourin n=1 Tax=Nocardia arizonensis TaxID=1141647 RepID=UPI0006CFAB82|nr:protealysin inhibitor emfourin [Nocardia arizonensis]